MIFVWKKTLLYKTDSVCKLKSSFVLSLYLKRHTFFVKFVMFFFSIDLIFVGQRATLLTIHFMTLFKGPSRQNGSKYRIFFYCRNVISRVLLITRQKIVSLRARKPPQNWGFACVLGIRRFTLSKLWGRFTQFQK